MVTQTILELTDGKLVCGDAGDLRQVRIGAASDLMSDVLTLLHDEMLLITGLANVQVVRTAMISEISHILLIRGKKAGKSMIELATENGLILIESPLTMFQACAVLYAAGLKPVY